MLPTQSQHKSHLRRPSLLSAAGCRLALCLLSVAIAHPPAALADGCKRHLRIGVSLPLTAGPAASGEVIRNSIQLADEMYDKSSCVDFIFEDDQFQPKNTVTVVNRFLAADKVQGLIVYGTPTSRAVTPIAEEAKVPLIAFSTLDAVVKDRKFTVKHWCTLDRLNAAVAAEAAERGYKTVAIVTTQNEAMLGLRDAYRADTKAKVVADWELAKDDFDYATIVAKLKALSPEALYVLLYPPQTGPFVRRVREAGYQGELFGVHNIEDLGEVKTSNGHMIGMWFANATAIGEQYEEKYAAKHHVIPALGGGSGFDAAKLFIESANSDVEPNEFLHTVKNFHGAYGIYSATGRADFDFPAVIKIVQPDSFRLKSPPTDAPAR